MKITELDMIIDRMYDRDIIRSIREKNETEINNKTVINIEQELWYNPRHRTRYGLNATKLIELFNDILEEETYGCEELKNIHGAVLVDEFKLKISMDIPDIYDAVDFEKILGYEGIMKTKAIKGNSEIIKGNSEIMRANLDDLITVYSVDSRKRPSVWIYESEEDNAYEDEYNWGACGYRGCKCTEEDETIKGLMVDMSEECDECRIPFILGGKSRAVKRNVR